ncbi:Polycomb group RING finger protein 6 [Chelonia mydas]|uniref:Polycomb group RING finger protein 6 n=1 Tax=Chelonia mydas TaxID=8469 RepID=M7BK78_CHEMY|nr:Polycomb group RING finger protein 6 [Chelonia mydas]
MGMEVDVGSVISGLSGADGAGLGPGEEELEVGGAPGCSGAGSLRFDFERSRSESSGEEEEEELEEEELEGGPGAGFGACREEEGELDSDDEREVPLPKLLLAGVPSLIFHLVLYNFKKTYIASLRLDRQLQDIVYKLVVNLEDTVPQPVPVSRGRPRKVLGSVFRIPPELDVSLLLEFIGANEGAGNFKPLEKKFVRVSGEATIGHVEKFLRRKMDLDPACQVDIICGDHLLEHYQTLREIRRAIGDSAMQVRVVASLCCKI